MSYNGENKGFSALVMEMIIVVYFSAEIMFSHIYVNKKITLLEVQRQNFFCKLLTPTPQLLKHTFDHPLPSSELHL